MTTHANLTYSTTDLNIVYTYPDGTQFSYEAGDLAWNLAATALVLMMYVSIISTSEHSSCR